MIRHRHRGICQDPECGRVWRENCEDCLREVTKRHTAQTGHPVHLAITADGEGTWGLRDLTRRAHRSLYLMTTTMKRGRP